MKATYGEPYGYEKPWPYETKKYNFINEWFDKTKARLNENSKVIVVDGNIAVGKNNFAKRLAKNFDLKYIGSVPDSQCFIGKENGFDLRSLNEFLTDATLFYDLEKWLTEPQPSVGRVGKLQLMWYQEKFMVYCHALHHLLSTGKEEPQIQMCSLLLLRNFLCLLNLVFLEFLQLLL